MHTAHRSSRTRCLLAGAMLVALQAAPAGARVPRQPGSGIRSEDFGNVAVIADNGVLVTRHNDFDLVGKTVLFLPAGGLRYTVSSAPGTLEPDYGPELTFGYPGVAYPGDDDSQEVAFPAGFPFFGATYTSVWVNTDGNITFGAPDVTSTTERDSVRHALGPPRVSGFLNDWSPRNALNPGGTGTVHAALKSGPDRLVVTWNGVIDYNFGGSSTFQITLYGTGAVAIGPLEIDPTSTYGVTGIAQGGGLGPVHNLDFSSAGSATLAGGALLEAFAQFTAVNELQTTREFYKTHPDKFDYVVIMSDFPVNFLIHHTQVSNQTHGIGTPLTNGQPDFPDTVYDRSAQFGSAGELEQMLFLNDIFLYPQSSGQLVNPPVAPYGANSNIAINPDYFGGPITLDGQPMAQARTTGTLVPDDGEISRYFAQDGPFSMWLASAMSMLAHEVEHRYGAYVKFVHPTKGIGFDSYDLLGLDTQHWSYFFNTAVPASQFANAPRSSMDLGNCIYDLGTPASYNGAPTNLAPGERVFRTPPDQLIDGFSALDQYLMGLRRASEVGPFFYVDEPRSIYTGQSLDDPGHPLDTSLTMRSWFPQGGIAFKGKRVDLTLQNIMDYEKYREKGDNPRGARFWGPKGKLTVRYFSSTGRVDPAGDAKVVLTEADRELGDEADMIDASGKPVDVKTVAFVLLVQDGPPSAHAQAIRRVDEFRRAWQDYINGPATGGRGRFDTSLNPPIY